jgi:hypothetical protein
MVLNMDNVFKSSDLFNNSQREYIKTTAVFTNNDYGSDYKEGGFEIEEKIIINSFQIFGILNGTDKVNFRLYYLTGAIVDSEGVEVDLVNVTNTTYGTVYRVDKTVDAGYGLKIYVDGYSGGDTQVLYAILNYSKVDE